jgi:hypothetical protein
MLPIAATLLCILALAHAMPTAQPTSSAQVSQEILDAQRAYWANLYVKDPETNLTKRNPSYEAADALAKREPFWPPNGADCRISAQRYYYIQQQCSSFGHCQDSSFETTELRIRDNNNIGNTISRFEMENGQEQYYQLDGHRGWIGAAWWDEWKMYGISFAYGRIEGEANNRSKSPFPCRYLSFCPSSALVRGTQFLMDYG